jgi:AcrR family transcriptional regulator
MIKNVKPCHVAKTLCMSPRPYKAAKRRQAATLATRVRIIEAARALLADSSASSFSIDAIAQRADVARMTVYYQFRSKGGLLEALFDDFGRRANMQDLRKAFADAQPARGLNTLVEVFCHLWESQGALLRRLSAMAILDPEVDRAVNERSTWRYEAIQKLVTRMPPLRRDRDEIVDVLYTLTSFETYSILAAQRGPDDVRAVLARAAAAILAAY